VCSAAPTAAGEGVVQTHSVHYGYPYVAADIICGEPAGCNATRVALSARCGAPHPGEPSSAAAASPSPPLVLTVHSQERRDRLWGVQSGALSHQLQSRLPGCPGPLCPGGLPGGHPLETEAGDPGGHPSQRAAERHERVRLQEHTYTSRYVLMADVDQLLVPYKHSSLRALVEELQAQREVRGHGRVRREKGAGS
jgi:hypothetical protein